MEKLVLTRGYIPNRWQYMYSSYKDYKPRSAYEGTPYVDNNGSLQYRFINDDGSVTNWNGMAFPLFERAVNSIKSQVPLDLDLDVDNDGCIDYITFCYARKYSIW